MTTRCTIYPLADKTWLFAFKNDDKWEFKALTVFPDDINKVKSGGVIVSEDLLNNLKRYKALLSEFYTKVWSLLKTAKAFFYQLVHHILYKEHPGDLFRSTVIVHYSIPIRP